MRKTNADTFDRYSIVPQMRDYDSLSTSWRPYTMFSQAPNYTSSSVNTDTSGQRYTSLKKGENLSWESSKIECSLIVGSSLAFGVGATDDSKTIASLLSKSTESLFFNLCGRAHNSKQELLMFINNVDKFKKLKSVILVSGLNNIYCSAFLEKDGDPFFFSDTFHNAMSKYGIGKRKMFLKYFFEFFGLKNIDWQSINKSNFIHKIFINQHSNYNEIFSNIIDVYAASERTCRDLLIWKMLSKNFGFKLSFCLQPVFGWMHKNLSVEEEKLFNILKKEKNNILLQLLNSEVYKTYYPIIRDFCEKNNIRFYDLNTIATTNKDWFFVDRVHLTDFGYNKVAEAISSNILGE